MKIEVNGKTINQSTSVKYLRIVILNGKIKFNKLPKEYQEVLVSFVKLGIMLMVGRGHMGSDFNIIQLGFSFGHCILNICCVLFFFL